MLREERLPFTIITPNKLVAIKDDAGESGELEVEVVAALQS